MVDGLLRNLRVAVRDPMGKKQVACLAVLPQVIDNKLLGELLAFAWRRIPRAHMAKL
jgi:hypothetical protein